VTLAALYRAVTGLGIDTNTIELFPDDLPARQNHKSFIELFPDLENALLIVVDGRTSEATRGAQEQLLTALRSDSVHFEDAYEPSGGSFFERHALLYRNVDELDEFASNMARVQPVITALEQDASIGTLAALIQKGLRQTGSEGGDPELWSELLDRVSRASVEIYQEHPVAVSWEEMMVRGTAIETRTRRVIVAHPVLDFSDALPGRAPLAALGSIVAELALDASQGVRVRVTGNPALTYEETLGLVWDIGVSSLFCLLLVSGILGVALRSLPLVAGVVATLIVGLICTAGFAAVAVGNLNVISVAAGVLFLGLGVDFGIHLAMRYADLLRGGAEHVRAMEQAARSVGSSLVLCTITTAIGFFAFLPTDYRGVAELGLITGVGLVIILALTLTLFPALMSTAPLHVDPRRLQSSSLRFGSGPARLVEQHWRPILWLCLPAGVLCLFQLSELRFDPNIVAMRDPSTESVQTFNDLLADTSSASPWHANSVVSSLEEAAPVRQQMHTLGAVSHAITLVDYVPEEQEEKLEILDEVAMLMDVPRSARPRPTQATVGEQVETLRDLHGALTLASARGPHSALQASVLDLKQHLGEFLTRVERERDPAAALAQLERVLLSSLPEQIERLRLALAASEVTLESLPPRLSRRLWAPGGEARVQIFPSENLENPAALARFVDAVRSVDPQVTGVAVNLVQFADTTQAAFRQALATALLVIAGILWARWRRPGVVLLVLVPLSLAAVLTGAFMVWLDLPLSFFNVVVIPLILGAGVDSGIHLVEQSRAGPAGRTSVLGSTTARAVLFSALTTIMSFGTLGFSSHVGLAGLGRLLTLGMTLMVASNLIVLPALLAWRDHGMRRSTPSLAHQLGARGTRQ
jgi:hopanoid biosynthesis associated RND transporter like protein HpnN